MLPKKILKFHNEELGATAVEYAVMLMLIIAACIALIQGIGIQMNEVWLDSNSRMSEAMGNQGQ